MNSLAEYKLYYCEKFCVYSQKIMQEYYSSPYARSTEYHSLDAIEIDEKGMYYVDEFNKQTKKLERHYIPPQILKIPALLIFNRNAKSNEPRNITLFGDEIINFLHPKNNVMSQMDINNPSSINNFMPVGGSLSGDNFTSYLPTDYQAPTIGIPTFPETKSSSRMSQDEMNQKIREFSSM